ncbi:MAG: porin [Thiolinea sp.]
MIKLFAAGVLVLAAPVYTAAGTVPFGKIKIDYNRVDANGIEEYQFNGDGTRLGVKGAKYLDETVEGSYIFEVAPAFDAADEPEVRQAWFGLRGYLGEVRAGRHLGPTRVALDPVDLFADQAADQNKVLESNVLHDKSVAYINRFNGVGYAIVFSSDDKNSHISTDVLVNYNAERFYIAAAYLKDYAKRDTVRVGAAYRFPEGHHLGAAVEHVNDTSGDAGYDAALLNGGYQIGKAMFKGQVGLNKADLGGKAETLLGFGVDYELWKTTLLQAQYSLNKHRDHSASDRERVFSVGLSYEF